MDASTRRKLDHLRRALFDAIADSEEASRRLAALQAEGFSLYLLVDGSSREGGDSGATGLDRTLHEEIRRRAVPGPRRQLPSAHRRALPAGEPTFRIHGGDVEWLRALGIDPTRKAKGRRRDPGR